MSKWEKVKLEKVCEILDSMRVPVTASDRKGGIYPYYGANGVQDYVSDYIFDDELVLLAEDWGNFGSKTRPIAYRVSGKCWVNNHAHVLKAKPTIDINYLCFSIMFYDVSKIISGTTRAKLNQAAMRKMTIPLPPLDTQKQIAKTLDTVAELLAMRKQQLVELDKLIKSTFYDLFGDPITNEKGWKLKPIGDFSMVKIGPFGTLLHADDYIEGGFPLVNPSHIIDGKIVPNMKLTLSAEKFEELQSYAMKKDDVVVGRRGEIGRCAIVNGEGLLCGTGSMFIRVEKDYLPIMLQHIISSDTIRAKLEHQSVGVTMKNLNAGTISNLEVPFIPLHLQTQFAEIVTKIEEQKALVQKTIDETQYLSDSLMSKYFEEVK